MKIAEAGIFYLFVPSMGKALNSLDPTIPIMLTTWIRAWKPILKQAVLLVSKWCPLCTGHHIIVYYSHISQYIILMGLFVSDRVVLCLALERSRDWRAR